MRAFCGEDWSGQAGLNAGQGGTILELYNVARMVISSYTIMKALKTQL